MQQTDWELAPRHCEMCKRSLLACFAPRNAGIFHDEKHPSRQVAMWWVHSCAVCTMKYIEKEYRNLYGDERNPSTGRFLYVEKARKVRIIKTWDSEKGRVF